MSFLYSMRNQFLIIPSSDRVRAISFAMGLTPVIWTVAPAQPAPVPFDTMDWQVPGAVVSASQVIAGFEAFLDQ